MNITKEQKESIALQAKRELAKRSFKYYLEYIHRGRYSHMPHTELICNELQPIIDGEERYIIVEMPPRHGKSMTISESFPSYFIGKNPYKRVIASAYSDNLARKFGRLNRVKLMEVGEELFDVGLSRSNNNVNNWTLDNNVGGMVSSGVGGTITGEGADLLIIDDPIKNNQEAQSETMRNKVWDEWESTLSTRLHKGASVIVVMTRWHEDDLIGRLLERSPHDWKRIRLPAIAEDEDDLLGREMGQALAPDLGFDEEWAAIKKLEAGSKTWASLFQQRPSAAEGNLFKREWWQYYKAPPARFDEQVISWDLTFKDNQESDFVVGQVWGRKDADFYLLDQVRGKMDFPTTLKAIKNLNSKYPRIRTTLIEDKANGSAAISTLKKSISGIVPISPKDSKIVRAQAITPLVEAGNVYIPEGGTFTSDYVEEFANFPNGKHDDMVDCTTQALDRLSNKRPARISGRNMW